MKRKFNFGAGPSTLPLEVLEQAAAELVEFNDMGLSLMESSHRAKLYDEVHNEAIDLIRELLKVPEDFSIGFFQGGASLQFAMVPMNLLQGDEKAQYINTGTWTKKAISEAKNLDKNIEVIATSEDTLFDRIPADIKIDGDAKYAYIASNNTIYGTQFKELPNTNGAYLVVDASSDIFSQAVDWSNIGILFAGAQKNAGPAGVTIAIIKNSLVTDIPGAVPTLLKYKTQIDANSLYNTPPTFGIYMLGLVMKWLKDQGGVEGIAKVNNQKASLIYNEIDNSDGFYKGHAQKDSRSLMNITFTLKDNSLDEKFIKDAGDANLMALKGHRSIGGMRASIYNAMPLEGAKALADFMKKFMEENK
jgi:phosphoserine aminotransferase